MRGELLNLHWQSAQVFERTFGEDGEFLGLAGQKFPPQRNQCFVQALQLLDRLGQDGFWFAYVGRRFNPRR